MHRPDCQHHGAGDGPSEALDGVALDRVSRRRLLTGVAAGIGLVATWGIGRAAASSPSVDRSASASDPAHRLEIPQYVPIAPWEPPAPGEILFPLALGGERNAYVLDNFGDTRGRCCDYYHKGVDIMAAEGTPQLAVVDGELTYRHDRTTFGWSLAGDDGTVYRYFHSAEDPNGWEIGDRVEQGDVIGFVSDSGTRAGNFHLHFEYIPNGSPANPYFKLQRIPGAMFPA